MNYSNFYMVQKKFSYCSNNYEQLCNLANNN